MPAKTGTNQRLVAGQTFVPDCREAADMATANPTALFTTLPRTEFIQKNLGLVHSCAGRFTGRGIEYEELYSAGCLGLVKALRWV